MKCHRGVPFAAYCSLLCVGSFLLFILLVSFNIGVTPALDSIVFFVQVNISCPHVCFKLHLHSDSVKNVSNSVQAYLDWCQISSNRLGHRPLIVVSWFDL